jgi:hypothetical protein
MSRIEGDVFGAATPVPELSSGDPVNDYYDQRPTIRSDGREIFLGSDRPGGIGSQDIWVSTRQHKDDAWSAPLNLADLSVPGARINTEFEDQHPSISPDGTTLFFSSRRPSPGEVCNPTPPNQCDLDLYVTIRTLEPND